MLRLLTGSAAAVVGVIGAVNIHRCFGHSIGLETVDAADLSSAEKIGMSQTPLPSRESQLDALQNTPEFDILIIGGGATGCGVALDAATRGLKTALVEKYDYACGTSSRSTKLIHGGVRYLQNAIMKLDVEQYKLVKEALHERANLLAIAPHLSKPLPIMLPVYKLWQVPYFWAGIKMYDLVAGKQLVKSSYFVNREKALETFPMLKADSLYGAIVYYDGQHNDSRMNVAIALTAIRHGAVCLNHVEVIDILKEKKTQGDGTTKEVVSGAMVRDTLTGKEWKVRAKCVVNATGPFTDTVRRMDNPEVKKICQPSSGVHIVLPDYYSPSNMGLLDPQTSDGRVIFFLPWEGKTIAGTTDSPCEVSFTPTPKETEIQFILKEIRDYLSADIHVRRGDVLAAWSGIRPLVTNPSSKDTKSISRNHVIEVSDANMVTIAGGKWTTYRSMASDTVDAAVKATNLEPKSSSQTDGLTLEGGEGWTPTLFIRLVQDFGLEPEVAQHLSRSYGNKAPQVAKMAKLTGKRWPVVGVRLVEEFPYIEAEIKYGITEYAQTAVDMIARRLRIAFLSVQAADEALPQIVQIMGSELGWDDERKELEISEARHFLDEMGYKNRVQVRNVPVNFTWDEVDNLTKIFKRFDSNNTGHVTAPAIRKMLSDLNENDISDDQLQQLIAEVDLNMNNTIELDEFLQLMSAFKTGAVSHNRLATLVNRHYHYLLDPIPTDRSGGGV